ncbi:MAG: SGNH/GDSL hydrolase family protein [Anaerolineaceae bacterium]|nr:SGNH/GDSL hydrolase family protein [Anaerolineaceae bacterium]
MQATQTQEVSGAGETRPTYQIVCFGDSITASVISASYIDLLRQRLGAQGLEFINSGVNGDLSNNLLRRIDHVIALQPDFIIIMIGTNDINADVNDSMYWIIRAWKGITERPTLESYSRNMAEITRQLKAQTSARIALASPPLVGEDLSSKANKRARQYSAALQEIAVQYDAAYIPVHERQEEELLALGLSHGGEYTRSALRSAELVLSRKIIRESYETISKRRGFHLVTDGIHMNCRGAEIIADEMEHYLCTALRA